MTSFEWPLAIVPEIAVAARFPLADRAFATSYCGRTHALHLHGYTGRIRLAGQEFSLSPGDATLSPAGLTSSYDLDAPGNHWCIHFGPANAAAVATLPLHIPAARTAGLRERMAHAAALFAAGRGQAIGRARAGVALQEALLALMDPQPECNDSAADRAAAFIDRHFHEAIGVAEIARAVGRSQSHLARVFRARFGTTIVSRLIERRAAHARFLLESTDLPIWRVAERVGIPDPQYFNKTVRRLLGASPSAVRAAAAAGARIDPDR